jgi:hypothetical protein
MCVCVNDLYWDLLSQLCVPSMNKQCTRADTRVRYESVLQKLLENPITESTHEHPSIPLIYSWQGLGVSLWRRPLVKVILASQSTTGCDTHQPGKKKPLSTFRRNIPFPSSVNNTEAAGSAETSVYFTVFFSHRYRNDAVSSSLL